MKEAQDEEERKQRDKEAKESEDNKEDDDEEEDEEDNNVVADTEVSIDSVYVSDSECCYDRIFHTKMRA